MIRRFIEVKITMALTLMVLVYLLNEGTALGSGNFTPCSQTCGGGFRYKVMPCERGKCPKIYEECNTNECFSRSSCPKNHELMYGKASCCANLPESCGVTNVGSSKDIYTTRKAVVGQFPWAAVVVRRRTNTRHCGGSLIYKDWILTPAHCVAWFISSDYYVLLGITSIKDQETSKQIFDIKKVILHEEYADPYNNIALVQLKKSATLNNFVKPICLPNGQKVKTGERCVFYGFGNLVDSPDFRSPTTSGGDLYFGTFRNWPEEVCSDALKVSSWRMAHYSKEQNLCFGDLSKSSKSCTADSGSAIICQSCSSCSWYIAGILSFAPSDRCSMEVSTDVANYEDWIRKQIAEKIPSRTTNTCDGGLSIAALCSKTCGGGHYYIEKCKKDKPNDCVKTYKECSMHECQTNTSCPKNHERMYGKASCCEILPESCGAANVGSSKATYTTRKAVVGQFPWAAVVVRRRTNMRYCGGSLIHKDWILLPAHCSVMFRIPDFYILLGITSIKDQESSKQIFDIEKVIIHEQYSDIQNNVALVQLKKSATSNDFVKPICLPNGQKVKTDERCVFYGFSNPVDFRLPNLNSGGDLYFGTIRNWPDEVCNDFLKDDWRIHLYYSKEQNLCFGDLSKSSKSCTADSGSAIICQSCSSCSWYIAGIPSFGPEDLCSMEVSTDVANYEDWIRKQIAEKLPSRTTNTCVGGLSTPSQCSKTCGGGHYHTCSDCVKTYKECNMHECQPKTSCPENQIHKFKDKSTCCVKSQENCGVASQNVKSRTKIIGGEKSEQLQWPWMAVVVNKTTRTATCGGSLIHKDWVLSAAHCIIKKNKKKLYILLGSTSIKYPKATKQIIEIENFFIHEKYSDPTNDIGLIKLKESANYTSFVKPICLPHGERIAIDMKCVAAGWGIARPEDIDLEKTSDVLQHVVLRSLPGDACRSGLKPISWRINFYNDEENVCFGKLSGGKDTCPGDSGGPIMCQRCSSCGWYVAGITSYGPTYCGGVAGQPGVYVYVKAYESWIRQKVYGSTSFESFSC